MDYDIVWAVVTGDLPILVSRLERLASDRPSRIHDRDGNLVELTVYDQPA